MPRKLASLATIRHTARQIVDTFQPDQVILFGSYAYGRPGLDSDVDLLVVMPARNEASQAIRIRAAVDHPFPCDLIVRTPQNLQRRLELGDWFLREIVTRGKVLYAKADRRMVPRRKAICSSQTCSPSKDLSRQTRSASLPASRRKIPESPDPRASTHRAWHSRPGSALPIACSDPFGAWAFECPIESPNAICRGLPVPGDACPCSRRACRRCVTRSRSAPRSERRSACQ